VRVAVVGAGFAGLATSIKLSRAAKVTLFEEHEEVGVPEHCTGIVSGRVWEELGSYVSKSVKEGDLSEFFIGLPSGKGVTLKGPKDFAVRLDRKRLEEEMLETALSMGVEWRVKLITDVTPKGSVHGQSFDRVFLAEGWRAELSSRLGIAARPRRLYGLNVEVRGRAAHPGRVEVWFDKALAPGFFAWVVMLEEKAVVGTAAVRGYNVEKLLSSTLEVARRRGLVEGEAVKRYGGVIQTGPPVLAPCLRAVCSAGDAAGLNKPVTGGGLYPSLDVAKKLPGNLNRPIKAYKIVPRLYAETAVARLLHGAPQRFYERLFSELDGEEWRISEYDNHLRSVREIIGEMRVKKFALLFLKALRYLLP